MKNKILSRREALRGAGVASGLAFLSPFDWMQKAWAATAIHRLSYLAYRSVEFEGSWSVGAIEGEIPKNLNGSLYRVGPGQKENHGVALTHIFDGDAYLTALGFDNGQVSAHSRFIETEERRRERAAGRMLYSDFGTGCLLPKGYKNSPNVNVIGLDQRLLALSEGGAPVAINPETLATEGQWNFSGSLPSGMTFTAHPKVDPDTGDTYCFGISQELNPQLKVFRHDRVSGRLHELYSVKLNGFYMVHDMMITKNHLVFVIPPMRISMLGAALTWAPIADLITYERDQPLRILVLRKDQGAPPMEMSSSPAACVFHHCNAFEMGHTISFDSVMMDDDSALRLVKSWSASQLPPTSPSWVVRFTLDLSSQKVISRERVSDGAPTDFPCIDPRRIGKKQRWTYLLEVERGALDPLAFTQLVCWNRQGGEPQRIRAGGNQVFGEPVYVPWSATGSEDQGWILHLGFDASCNQTFLDIRQAVTLERIARVWMNRYFPLGFHGSFINQTNLLAKTLGPHDPA